MHNIVQSNLEVFVLLAYINVILNLATRIQLRHNGDSAGQNILCVLEAYSTESVVTVEQELRRKF